MGAIVGPQQAGSGLMPSLCLALHFGGKAALFVGLQLFSRPVPNSQSSSLSWHQKPHTEQPGSTSAVDEAYIHSERRLGRSLEEALQWQRVVSSRKPSCGPHLVRFLHPPFCTSPWPELELKALKRQGTDCLASPAGGRAGD